MKRIIIAGGGTGGHFYPGFSLAKELIKKGLQVVFAVKKEDISIPVLRENDIPFVEIDMIALPRSINPFRHAVFFWKLAVSVLYSFRILRDFAPEAVLGTGSYVAFPLVLSARLKKIRTLIHESNSVLGLSNYLSGFFAHSVLTGLPLRNDPFPHKTRLTGTPLRESFFSETSKEEAKKKLGLAPETFTLLVFGGSQGSKNINETAYRLALDAVTRKEKIQLLHLTGRKNYEEIKGKYEAIEVDCKCVKVYDYYENMNELYSAADLVISRSGSGTVNELITMKRPAILVPLRTAAADHQTLNAETLARYACALILKDDENLYKNIKTTLEKLINPANLAAMAKGYERIDIPSGRQAAENIIKLLE